LLLGSCVASFCVARLVFVTGGYLDAPATHIEAPAPAALTVEAPATHTMPPPVSSPPAADDSTAALPAAPPSAPLPPQNQPSPSAPADQGAADAAVKTDIDSPKAAAGAPSEAAPAVDAATPPPSEATEPAQAETDANDPNVASPATEGEAEPVVPLAGSDASTPDVSTPEAQDESTPGEKPVTASPKKPSEPSRQARQMARTKPEPRAMQLAPANEPIRPATASGYGARVRSMLAHHRPVAGARGSATVTFSIGRNGALRSVRVSQSSGSARLDQMALATVRGAAPFPAPPANLAAGGLSYSIRIYFR
jgi:protein TonB